MATTATVQPELGQTVYIYAWFNFLRPIGFCWRPRHTLCKTDLDGLARLWANTFCLEASQCATIIGPGFWQNTTSPLPASRFQTQARSSTGNPDHIVQNQPSSSLVLVDCQVLAKQIRSGSKPVCKNHLAHFWPTLPSQSRSDANWIRHVYWNFTETCRWPDLMSDKMKWHALWATLKELPGPTSSGLQPSQQLFLLTLDPAASEHRPSSSAAGHWQPLELLPLQGAEVRSWKTNLPGRGQTFLSRSADAVETKVPFLETESKLVVIPAKTTNNITCCNNYKTVQISSHCKKYKQNTPNW